MSLRMCSDLTPFMRLPVIVPARTGSSPAYSKLRPLRGSRMMSTPPPMDMLEPQARSSANDGAVEEGCIGVPTGGCAERGGKEGGVAALVGGHAEAYGGVGEVDAGDAEALDAGHVAGGEVGVGIDGSAFAKDSPAGAVDHGDLFVEGQLLEDEVGALIGGEGLVHPGHFGCVGFGFGVCGCVGDAGQDQCGQNSLQVMLRT